MLLLRQFTVEPAVSAIDFVVETAENIQLFTTSLQDGQVSEYALTPVSYTHLDVYKRQLPMWTEILHCLYPKEQFFKYLL